MTLYIRELLRAIAIGAFAGSLVALLVITMESGWRLLASVVAGQMP